MNVIRTNAEAEAAALALADRRIMRAARELVGLVHSTADHEVAVELVAARLRAIVEAERR